MLCPRSAWRISLMKTGYLTSHANFLSMYSIRDCFRCSIFLLPSIILRHFLTSSYDGSIRVFSYAQSLLLTSPLHTAPITSISLIPSASPSNSTRLVATASHDLAAQISEISLPLNQNDMDVAPSTKTIASLHLHTAPLSAIHSNSTGSRLLTSSWDGLIGLWDTTAPDSDEIPLIQIQAPGYGESGDRKKRRKIEKDADGETSGKGAKGIRKAPSAVLKSHTARVSDVQFVREDEGKAVSCGFDLTVREWDVENGVCTNTIVRPFYDPFPR